ncbi:MAG: hypothetical protein IIA62_00980 [Nitrospinae bacterium]|nr:hypothetical protein [Nitrospinota bacterium]
MVHAITAKMGATLNLKVALMSLVAAVAVAIPSLGGTLADFTAVTTNPGNSFQSAVLTMTTDHPASSFVSVSDLIPGDSATRSVTVENTGSVPFTYVISASNEGGPPSALWQDKDDGLQVVVSDENGQIYSGPIKDLDEISAGVEVAAGDTHVLTYVLSLPNSAGNAFQGLSQGIGITYDATQLAGQAR